tara:strand:- start:321 stop:551 length:231 start_codon:yes stop_codon:yes gene_type:complete
MAAPFYALARRSPCSSDPDRVAVIPAAIYVTNTLCGDKDRIARNTLKVNKTAVFGSFDIGCQIAADARCSASMANY